MLHKNIWNYKDAFNQNLYLINQKIIEENNKEFVITPIDKFEKSYDLFWSKNRKDYKNILDRRSSFLNWRYLKRPDDQYKPFFVYQKIVRIFYSKKYYDGKTLTIHVIDLFFKDTSQSNFNKLFKNIFSYIKKSKNI